MAADLTGIHPNELKKLVVHGALGRCRPLAGLAELSKARGVICAVESCEPGTCSILSAQGGGVLGFTVAADRLLTVFLPKPWQKQVEASFELQKCSNRPARPSQAWPSEQRSKQAITGQKHRKADECGLEEFK